MAYFEAQHPVQRNRGLRGDGGSCCSSCASGHGCSGDGAHLQPPVIMQGPWAGPRLVYEINNADSALAQTGGLPPVHSEPETWGYQLENMEARWRG